MRTIQKSLLGAVAVAAALLGAATEARAQTFTKVVDIETVGGFVAYQSHVSIWYYSATGKGFVQFRKAFHDGTNLDITTQISAADMNDVWWKAYYAKPWLNAQTKAGFLNPDVASTRMTYMTNWSQLVRADLGASSLPAESQEMKTCISKVWDIAQKAADSDLFRFTESGGIAGMSETIVITQDGKITFDKSFGRGVGAPVTHKEGSLSAQDVNDLKTLCANWWSFPASFEWPRGTTVADAMYYTGTYNTWGYSKAVASKTAAQEDPAYTAVITKVGALANAIP